MRLGKKVLAELEARLCHRNVLVGRRQRMGINNPFSQWTKMRRYRNLEKSIPMCGYTVV